MVPRLTSALLALAVLPLPALVPGASPAAGTSAAVYPTAGTPTASPKTQISFRGVAPGALTGIDVRGSRSGPHPGRLAAHSDGDGASFLPDHPFRDGETVTVRADVPLVGARDGAVTFTIA